MAARKRQSTAKKPRTTKRATRTAAAPARERRGERERVCGAPLDSGNHGFELECDQAPHDETADHAGELDGERVYWRDGEAGYRTKARK